MADEIKVITDDSCSLGNQFIPGLMPAPDDSIVVRSKPGIFNGNIINELEENGVKIYELDDYVLEAPDASFNNNGGIVEVGNTITPVVFTGFGIAKTNPISSRTLTPDPGGVDLTLVPFTFSKSSVTRATPGRAQEHTLLVTDNAGYYTQIKSWIPFKYKIYQGFNSLAVLDQTAIKALVNFHLRDAIIQEYGGEKTYTVPASPAGPKYIYWCAPLTSTMPTSAVLNGLPLPLYFGHPTITVTNIYGVSVDYWVIRTANRLDSAAYNINLIGPSVTDEENNSENTNAPVSTGGGTGGSSISKYLYPIYVGVSISTTIDNATQYFGNVAGRSLSSTPATMSVRIPKAGTIRQVYMAHYSLSAGTAEPFSIYIRLNNTTNYLIATVAQSQLIREFINLDMNIPVTESDIVEIFIQSPVWATNPSSHSLAGNLMVEVTN